MENYCLGPPGSYYRKRGPTVGDPPARTDPLDLIMLCLHARGHARRPGVQRRHTCTRRCACIPTRRRPAPRLGNRNARSYRHRGAGARTAPHRPHRPRTPGMSAHQTSSCTRCDCKLDHAPRTGGRANGCRTGELDEARRQSCVSRVLALLWPVRYLVSRLAPS
jgi:hypothetical protein